MQIRIKDDLVQKFLRASKECGFDVPSSPKEIEDAINDIFERYILETLGDY